MSHRVRSLTFLCLLVLLTVSVTFAARSTRAQSNGISLEYNQSLGGTLDPDFPVDSYTFSGQAHDLVTIEIDSITAGVDLKLALLGPNGARLMSNDDAAFGADKDPFLSLFLPESGVYTVQVIVAGNVGGSYQIHLLGRAPVKSHQLQFGVPVEVDVRTDPIPAYFTFKADPTCPTTLTVYDISTGKPHTFPFVVIIRDQDGTPVEMLQGGRMTENRMTVSPEPGTAPTDGLYEVEVASADHAAFGSLMLVVTCADQVPTCFVPPVPAATEPASSATTPVPGASSTPAPEGTPTAYDPCDADEQTTQRDDGTPVIITGRDDSAVLADAVGDDATAEATNDGPMIPVPSAKGTPVLTSSDPCVPPCSTADRSVPEIEPIRNLTEEPSADQTETSDERGSLPLGVRNVGDNDQPCIPVCPPDASGTLTPSRVPVIAPDDSRSFPESTEAVGQIQRQTDEPCIPVCPPSTVTLAPAREPAEQASSDDASVTDEAPLGPPVPVAKFKHDQPCVPTCPPSGDRNAVAVLADAASTDPTATPAATEAIGQIQRRVDKPCIPTCPPSDGRSAELADEVAPDGANATEVVGQIQRKGDENPCVPTCPGDGSRVPVIAEAGSGENDLGIIAIRNTDDPCATPTPIATETPTVPVIATRAAIPPATFDCGSFRLTSPTDGLPNGGITVYWDPLRGATGYRVNVYNESKANVLSIAVGAGVTNAGINVSEGAIGGGYTFTVQVQALVNGAVKCSSAVTEQRVASGGGGGGGHPKPSNDQCRNPLGLPIPCDD